MSRTMLVDYLLNCIVVMSLVAVATGRLLHGDEDDICHLMPYDETCPTDCSQSALRYEGYENDLDAFNCTVGTAKDVLEFKRNNKYLYNNSKLAQFAAPTLIGVDFYMKQFDPSLNITFLLPSGTPNVRNDYDYARAVMLKFQSVGDKNLQDHFYYRCLRERIFRFTNWRPATTYDSVHPRNISYKCLVGLNNDASIRVYLINLASVPGHNITYTVTVFPLNHSAEDWTWKPVIATSFDIQHRSIYVVFEEAPALYRLKYYRLYLLDSSGKVVNKSGKLHKKVTYTFVNVEHGKYRIKVSVYGWGSKCRHQLCVNATSTDVDARAIPSDEFPIHYPEEMSMAKVVAMVTGGLVTLVLVLIVACLWRRKDSNTAIPPGSKPSGLIIHAHHYSPEFKLIVDKLGHFLQNICDVSINIDIWHSKIISQLPLPSQNSKTFVADGNRQRLTSKIHDWVQQQLETVSFVVIVCAPMQTGSSSLSAAYFQTFLEMAHERSKSKNNLWIIPVCFTAFATSADVPVIISSKPVYYLMKDMDRIYCKIHGLKDLPKNKKACLNLSSYIGNSMEGRELFEAVEKAATETCPSAAVAVNNLTATVIHDEKDKTCTTTLNNTTLVESKPNVTAAKPLPDHFKNAILGINIQSKEENEDCGIARMDTEKAVIEKPRPLDPNHRLRHHSEGSPFNPGNHIPKKVNDLAGRMVGNRVTAEVHYSSELPQPSEGLGNQDERGCISMPMGTGLEMVELEDITTGAQGTNLTDPGTNDLANKGQDKSFRNHQYIDGQPKDDHMRYTPTMIHTKNKRISGNGIANHRYDDGGHHNDMYSSKIKQGDCMHENHHLAHCNHNNVFPNHHGDDMYPCENSKPADFMYGNVHGHNRNIDREFIPCESSAQVPQKFAHCNHHAGLDLQHRGHIPSGPVFQGHGNHLSAQSNYLDQGCGHDMVMLPNHGGIYRDVEHTHDRVPYQTHNQPYSDYYEQDQGHCMAPCYHGNANFNYGHPEYNCRHIHNEENDQQKCEINKKTRLPTQFVAVDPPAKVKDTDNETETIDSGIQSGETDHLLNNETCKEHDERLQEHCDPTTARGRSYSFERLGNSPDDMFYPPDKFDTDMSDGSVTSSLMDQMDCINMAQY